jgi:hypothetical protein
MEKVQTITVFYSWQSDLDAETNKDAIEDALQNSKIDIEKEIANINLNIDDAVRNTTGSININQSILDKISKCDIFICDVTPINHQLLKENKEAKPIPNPNVMFELGFAVSKLGWERIWLLFNLHYCSSIKLPFDIGNNITHGYLIAPKNEGKYLQNLANLTTSLTEKLKNIILKNPPKGYELEKLDPEKVKRERDIRCLNRFLEMIHFKTLKDYLIGSPDFVEAGYFLMILNLFYVYKDFDFSINDVRLEVHINEFYTALMSISQFFQYYKLIEGTDKYAFDDNVQDAFDVHKIIKNNNKKTEVTFRLLLSYIKEKYIEIDTDETNKIAQSSVKNTAILLAFTALRR